MRRSYNNSGTVTKLKGNRKNPYMARLPVQTEWDADTLKAKYKQIILGYYRTESEARRALVEYSKEHPNLFANNSKRYSPANYTCDVLWERFISEKSVNSLKNQAFYRTCWNNHLTQVHGRNITEIKTTELQGIIDKIDKGAETKRKTLSIMKAMYDYAISDDALQKNYAEYVKIENEEVQIDRIVYTPNEIKELWNHTELWEVQLILMMMYSGCRMTELLSLKKEDVNLQNMSFHISKGKNKYSVRDVPIHTALQSLFRSLMGKTTDYLIKCENKPIKPHKAYHSEKAIEDIIDVEHHMYDAKHTFVTQAVKCGMNEEAKHAILGHTPKTIAGRHYTHLDIDFLHQEIEKVQY